MRILMTGSSGLVGTVMTARLAALGHEVVEFDATRSEDIRARPLITEAARGCDGIVHLAAISRVAWGETHPELTRSINVDGTQSVIKAGFAARSRPWFLFASSREVYGDPTDPIVTEDAPIQPVNIYGRSKADGEILVDRARNAELQTATIRLSNVYGGRRDHSDRAVPALVARALANLDLTITGPSNYFDFVHVEDSVAGLIAAMYLLASGETALPPIHLATGIPTTLAELAELAIAATGSTSQIIPVAPRTFDVSGFCGHPGSAEHYLGWRPTVPLAEGVARVAHSLREDGPLPDARIPFGP